MSLPQHLHEAHRLLYAGLYLVDLYPYSKQPVGLGWNDPSKRVRKIRPEATGYGLPLALNKLCSVDPDHLEFARRGLAACGFSLEEVMSAGARTCSTRPNSGGRSAFSVDNRLTWLKFLVCTDAGNVTALELRAASDNLQDCVPGVLYRDSSGNNCIQEYAGARRLDDAPELPTAFADWWARMSEDHAFFVAQSAVFQRACGSVEIVQPLPTKAGAALPYASPLRVPFNALVTVPQLLDRNGYVWDRSTRRYSPPTATGAPGVRPIPGRDGLWRSDHASDPLSGTFDAWVAFVVLEHSYDVKAAERAARAQDISGPSADISDFDVIAPPASGNPPLSFLDELIVTSEMVEKITETQMAWHGCIAKGHVAVWAGPGNAGKSAAARQAAADMAANGLTVWYLQEDAAMSDLRRLQAHAETHGYKLLNSTLGRRTVAEVLTGLNVTVSAGTDLGQHVFVFDTLKKFLEILEKREAKGFFVLMRSITIRGGTVLLLGHTNKHTGADGKPVFEGVGDVRNDVDELFYVAGLRDDTTGVTTITITPDKVRCLAQPLTLLYNFAADTMTVSDTVLNATLLADRKLIDIAGSILLVHGNLQKQAFVSYLIEEGVSRREADRVIETYSKGPHRKWIRTPGVANNSVIFSLAPTPLDDFDPMEDLV